MVSLAPPPPTSVAPPPPAAVAPPPRSAPPPVRDTLGEQTRETAAAARAAISGGELERARQLIDGGRQAAPADPVWDPLDVQWRAQEKNAEGSLHLRRGVDHFTGGRHADAIAAYDQALAAFAAADAIAPGNPAALDGKVNATRYKQRAEQAQQESAAGRRRFSETETELIVAKHPALAR